LTFYKKVNPTIQTVEFFKPLFAKMAITVLLVSMAWQVMMMDS
jgi:hypothetical protein